MKKKMSRILALALALSMLVACALPLTSCGDDPTECTQHTDADKNGKCDTCGADVSDEGNGGQTGGKKTYTVNLKTAAGKVLSGVSVFIVDTANPDFLKHAKTDDKGKATFELAQADTYAIELDNVPSGYNVKDQYPITSTTTDLVISSSLRPNTGLSGVSYSVGDIAYDATFTDPDGNKINFAEILKTKKAIVLNFWYTTCTYCLQEFPYIQDAYDLYSDNIEVIAVNDYADDDNFDVKNFKEQYGYTFPMVKDNAGLYNACGFTVAPCTVVIDRYGMITVMEAGAILGTRYWTNFFEYLQSPDYDQRLLESIMQLSPTIKPDIEMESSETISGAINKDDDLIVTYHPETNPSDAEYSWPFITTTKGDVTCIKPSNSGIDSSYATIYATVQLKAGEAFMFDYLSSTQADDINGYYDTLYVIVDGNDICSIQGSDEIETWKKCCAYVAPKDGTYEIALCYVKDSSEGEGNVDDAVYITNVRTVAAADVDVESYIYREAATDMKEDHSGYNTYVDIVLGADGYYHVGTADGPILIAKLIDYSNFESDNYVSYRLYNLPEDRVFNVTEGGVTTNKFNHLELYCSYASNATMYGLCPVTPELKTLLEAYVALFANEAGKIAEENMWMQLCIYYDAYGTNGKQLDDPIKGLSSFSAFDAELSTENNKVYNEVTYKRVVMPRGYFYKFTPTTSGVYRVLSQSAYEVDGWIFKGSHDIWAATGDRGSGIIADSNQAERIVPELLVDTNNDGKFEFDTKNCTIIAYLEAGVDYYIDIAFYDTYQFGSFTFTVEYVGETFDVFKMASPGPFTYEETPDGSIGNTIHGGIDVALGSDGYYHHKLGVDKDGNDILGSIVYADLIMTTSPFPTQNIQQLIDKGAFDFSKTETDLRAIALKELYIKGDDYSALRAYWGEDFEANWIEYQMDDILDGIYHGRGQDYTAKMQQIYDASIEYTDESKTDIKYPEGHPELQGCVAVNEELAEILQLLMDKFTFNGVEESWVKLCYYYETLGATEG